MKTTLILHGHFYQPPREMPGTGIIPKQDSAFPHNDWNIRIAKECYAANAYSRYLNYDGRVISIVNNYEYLSFNFGPTLLHWLLEHDRSTYERIIEADRFSVQNNDGHGNAIAQGFNHTILPLDSYEDAYNQICWGLEDFSYHFGREAEGIWLPEAAVNRQVIDILADQKVSFVVLSPWQAAAIEQSDGSFVQLHDRHAPYDTPFILEGDTGSVTAFFYHPGLAQGISFDHYLRDADLLYGKLLDIQEEDHPALLHSATDGEIFGHHEPFGDMCLAALINKIQESDDFSLSNYGAYAEKNPPKRHARLRSGEDAKGSSWSCFHGVSRWYKDCGCSTGGQEGWNQQWRTPLRNAFSSLSRSIYKLYEQEIKKLLPQQDALDILTEYGKVASGRETPFDFAVRFLGTGADKQKVQKLLLLLEGQRYRMYTFTSCGWFFSEVSGIEPMQNMRYAIQAIELYRDFTEHDLIHSLSEHLDEAKSNIPSIGTAKDILLTIIPSLPRGFEAAAFFTLNKIIALKEQLQEDYGFYRLLDIGSPDFKHIDLTIFDIPLNRTSIYSVRYEFDDIRGIVLYISDAENPDEIPIQVSDLPDRMITTVYSWIDDSLSRVADNDIPQISYDISHYSSLIRQGACSPDDSFYITNMGTCLRTLHSLLRQDLPRKNEQMMPLVMNLLGFIRLKADDKIVTSTEESISRYLNRHADRLQKEYAQDQSRFITGLLERFRSAGFSVDMTYLQNIAFSYITEVREGRMKADDDLIALCREANLIVDDFTAGM